MIDLAKQEIVFGESRSPITAIEVWWTVEKKGLYMSLEEALKEGRPLFPTPVAVANGCFEVLPPELE